MEELVFCSLGGISGFSGSWWAVGTWGKGLCRCEHKDVCCPLGKISLTGKRVNVTQKTAGFHISCTVEHLCQTSGLSVCSLLMSIV